MADSFDNLRAAVQDKLNQQRARAPEPGQLNHARLLGEFVEASLKAQHMTVKDFARRLDIEIELAQAILDGQLPDSELDDGLLADIAGATGHTFNTVRVLMGKPITPTLSVSRTAQANANGASSGAGRRSGTRRSRP
jgi:hypothetical protein